MDTQLAPTLFTALMAGLLGSGHCFAMCGGIAASGDLQAQSTGPRVVLVGLFNLGRLGSYAGLGAVIAGIAGVPAALGNGIPAWGVALRLLTAVLILLIGLQFLTGLALLAPLERLGGRLWARIRPASAQMARFQPPASRFLLGLLWGLLPCGLVYSALLLAAATADAMHGTLVMLAFGLGTFPSMLGMGLAAGSFGAFLREKLVRRFVGAGLVLLAAWSIHVLWLMQTAGAGHVH